MTYTYHMKGTCAHEVTFEIEDGKLHNIAFKGGCNGNLKAISKLCEGKDAMEIANILNGNICGMKATSCADQLSKGIVNAINEANNG